MAAWAGIWGLPDLADTITIEFSPRIRRSLGRCDPRRGIIRLNPALRDGAKDLLLSTLCHEAAHAAAYRIHGARIRPHGREWASLMTAAGFKPRARMRTDQLPDVLRRRAEPKTLYLHRCGVCQAQRTARRPFRRWACRRCVDAGLSGRLEIVSIPAKQATGR